VSCDDKPAKTSEVYTPKTVENAEFVKIWSLLNKGHSKLKYPKITFQTPEGRVKLYRAGERSRIPGSVNVMLGDAWSGRILESGAWELPGRGVSEWLKGFVELFAADPGEMAKEYGQASANCCFCHTTITTKESLAAGYGPTCASNYGLAWGGKGK